MGFVRVNPAPKAECKCRKPDSKHGTYFGPGTIWVCDLCGSAWEFEKATRHSDQRDGDWWEDKWVRNSRYNGPDNRPHPEPPKVIPYSGTYGYGELR